MPCCFILSLQETILSLRKKSRVPDVEMMQVFFRVHVTLHTFEIRFRLLLVQSRDFILLDHVKTNDTVPHKSTFHKDIKREKASNFQHSRLIKITSELFCLLDKFYAYLSLQRWFKCIFFESSSAYFSKLFDIIPKYALAWGLVFKMKCLKLFSLFST